MRYLPGNKFSGASSILAVLSCCSVVFKCICGSLWRLDIGFTTLRSLPNLSEISLNKLHSTNHFHELTVQTRGREQNQVGDELFFSFSLPFFTTGLKQITLESIGEVSVNICETVSRQRRSAILNVLCDLTPFLSITKVQNNICAFVCCIQGSQDLDLDIYYLAHMHTYMHARTRAQNNM